MKIRITPPDGAPPREIELSEEITSIGRDDECTITLDERTVSRQHAELYEDETGTLMVRDVGSRYGTRLNGRPVKDPSPFYHGDVLDVGGFAFEVPGSTVEAGPSTGEMETRRLKKDTRGVMPTVTDLTPAPRGQKVLSWLWVVLLLAGLTILGIVLADYLSGGDSPDPDAALVPAGTSAPGPRACSEDASWPSSMRKS